MMAGWRGISPRNLNPPVALLPTAATPGGGPKNLCLRGWFQKASQLCFVFPVLISHLILY